MRGNRVLCVVKAGTVRSERPRGSIQKYSVAGTLYSFTYPLPATGAGVRRGVWCPAPALQNLHPYDEDGSRCAGRMLLLQRNNILSNPSTRGGCLSRASASLSFGFKA